jgi:hypothetical protein
MRTAVIALAALLLLSLPGPASAQAQTPGRQCLHDQLETRTDRIRRDRALELAADINRAQGLERRFGRPGGGDYKPLDQLSNLKEVPDGFRVQLLTDGKTYSLSIKDTRDPCGYAIFSDQSLDIYEAVPSSRLGGTRLLTSR